MNALKHGLDAKTIVLPGEDQAAYRARLEAWRAEHRPRNPEEDDILERAVALSWQLDRAIAVQAAHTGERIRLAQSDDARRQQAEADAAEAAEVGQRLLDGPPAPKFKIDKIAKRLAMMYASPFWSQYTPLVDINRLRGKRLVMPVHPDDPEHPARLLRWLESSAAGCRSLLDRWAELRDALEAGPCWTAAQRLAAVRLLGLEPVDALEDPRVQAIYLACFVLDPEGPRVFTDQAVETTRREFNAFLQLLGAQGARQRKPRNREAARSGLRALVDGVVEVLEARLAGLEARAADRAATAADRLAFDTTAEGDRRHRLQIRLLHALLRTLDELTRARRRPEAPAPRRGPPLTDAASPVPLATCEEIRNEANAPYGPAAIAVRKELDGDEAPSALGARKEPDADGANPACAATCEEIRNEANAEADASSSPDLGPPDGPRFATRAPVSGTLAVAVAASGPGSVPVAPRPRVTTIPDGGGLSIRPGFSCTFGGEDRRVAGVGGRRPQPPGAEASAAGGGAGLEAGWTPATPPVSTASLECTATSAECLAPIRRVAEGDIGPAEAGIRCGRPPPPRDEAPGGTRQTPTGPAKPATDRCAGPSR
jgi:hypothetical protein